MSSGPLPKPGARRRNAPTIPTTTLPAGGYAGEIPEPPPDYDFLKPARSWWSWVWRTPQAAAFGTGSLYSLARRAQLEDDLWLLEKADEFDLGALMEISDKREMLQNLEFMLRKLKALAGGKASLLKEMRELDKRFGLDPKALSENRWTVEEVEAPPAEPSAAPAAAKTTKPRRILAVDVA